LVQFISFKYRIVYFILHIFCNKILQIKLKHLKTTLEQEKKEKSRIQLLEFCKQFCRRTLNLKFKILEKEKYLGVTRQICKKYATKNQLKRVMTNGL